MKVHMIEALTSWTKIWNLVGGLMLFLTLVAARSLAERLERLMGLLLKMLFS